MLEKLGVEVVWDDEDCEYFAYDRGVFSRDPASITCEADGQGPATGFDEQAQVDFDTVRAALERSSDSIEYAAVWHGSASIEGGSYFIFDPCTTLVYSPGYTGPGEIDEDALFHPIDNDWYAISYCR